MSVNKGRNSIQKRKLKTKLFGGRTAKQCCFCTRMLTPSSATLEHVIPLSRGGGWDIGNLRLSCHCCNEERSNSDFLEYKKGKVLCVNSR